MPESTSESDLASPKMRDDGPRARDRELSEVLARHRATTEILRIIADAPSDLQKVFDMIARSVAGLCDVRFCQVFQFDGRLVHFAAHQGLSPKAIADIRQAYPMPPGRTSAVARAVLTSRMVHIPNIDEDTEYTRRRFAKLMNFRSVMAVPMLKDGRPVGAIAMARSRTGHFPEWQIELLRTFADQAVIAIENARLFDEVQDKSRQLEVANKYKSHFLASASHDLRQPLHALNLFVAQLYAETNPTERNRLMARIDAAVDSMNELFGALLDMAKLDAGILDRTITEFPLARLFRRIETTFAETAREKGLRLRMVASGAWVRSDFILLERILLNFVSNAVHYTTRGGIVIGSRQRGERLRIDICDSGPGIAEEQQRDIFTEYYRLAPTGTDHDGGLGLGLAIVDRLAGLLDHKIELESHPGRGSRFSIVVPRGAQRGVEAEVSAVPAIADPALGKLVLVIDDDLLVLDGMRGILQSWGCDVLTAESEDAALVSIRVRGRPPDLIISDYRLADGRTGIEAIERLRNASGAAIPAFLISGDTAPERLRDASRSGYRLLHKPVPPMRLRAMLNRLLNEGKAAGESGCMPNVRSTAVPLPARQPR